MAVELHISHRENLTCGTMSVVVNRYQKFPTTIKPVNTTTTWFIST